MPDYFFSLDTKLAGLTGQGAASLLRYVPQLLEKEVKSPPNGECNRW